MDVFVRSSDHEGTPNAVLEAMAFSRPVVATDAGGTAELARPNEHALIVPTGDAGQLADAIVTVLSDPIGAQQRAALARARVEGELSFSSRMHAVENSHRTGDRFWTWPVPEFFDGTGVTRARVPRSASRHRSCRRLSQGTTTPALVPTAR
jgi:hypothetical protein